MVREVPEDVAVLPLLDRWMSGEMSVNEVLFAAGVRKLAPLAEAARQEQYDEDTWQEVAKMTATDHERAELERIAHEMYPDFLKEEPGYLDAIVTKLRYQKQKTMRQIGAGLVKNMKTSAG